MAEAEVEGTGGLTKPLAPRVASGKRDFVRRNHTPSGASSKTAAVPARIRALRGRFSCDAGSVGSTAVGVSGAASVEATAAARACEGSGYEGRVAAGGTTTGECFGEGSEGAEGERANGDGGLTGGSWVIAVRNP
jgi:hypothetical protein